MLKNKKNISIFIDERYCKGCDICVELCDKDVFTTAENINQQGYYIPVVSHIENCSGCMICDLICPEFAVVLKQETNEQE